MSLSKGTPDAALSVEGILGLLATGATGQILMALEAKPLRTKKLTEQIPTYSPRTIYRQARKLTEMGLIDRHETGGVPSTVVHSLSEPGGRDLVRLLDSYARALLPGSPASNGVEGFWTALGLIGAMWGSGWVDQLSQQGRSATELSERTGGLTFHQVTRRTQQLISWGLLVKSAPGQGKRFHLTVHARQGMAMVAAVGRWRAQHLLEDSSRGLSVPEMATVLRASLPLIDLPEFPGATLKLGIVDAPDALGENSADTVSLKVGTDGRIRCVKDKDQPDAWALCTVESWFGALLDGDRAAVRIGGDTAMANLCLKQLHEAFWAPSAIEQVPALD